jgi:hypothetical protein
MASATIDAARVAKRPVAVDVCAYVSGPVHRLNPVVPLEQPRPAANAKGTLSNSQLWALAKRHRPPQPWYEGEEEQLF